MSESAARFPGFGQKCCAAEPFIDGHKMRRLGGPLAAAFASRVFGMKRMSGSVAAARPRCWRSDRREYWLIPLCRVREKYAK
jgi:hypothetical protein